MILNLEQNARTIMEALTKKCHKFPETSCKPLSFVILFFVAMLLKTNLLMRKCAINEQEDCCFVTHKRCPPGIPDYRGEPYSFSAIARTKL